MKSPMLWYLLSAVFALIAIYQAHIGGNELRAGFGFAMALTALGFGSVIAVIEEGRK